jgi:acetoin utilization deacetylase AcuC-like enzyme
LKKLALTQVNITDFAQMVKIIKGLGDELWDDHLVFSLEGDYNLKALVASVKATFDMLLGNTTIEDPLGKSLHRSEALNTASLIKEMKERHNLV